MGNEGIAYQNKDIASKVFAERFKNKSLTVYGLNIPKIIQVLPTNLPEVTASELRIDNLFLLEDGSIAIIDYESDYHKQNKVKYIGYIHRILDRYFREGKTDVTLRMIVIYTADVAPDGTNDTLDAGAIKISVDAAFLSKLDSEQIRKQLNEKIKAGEDLTESEIMEFIILPLTYKKDKQGEAIEETLNLAKKIKDENTMVFVIAGILVFSDKVIDEELSKRTKEWIKMTKVGRLFVEEAEQQVQLTDARRIVSMIESFARADQGTIEEACRKAGITKSEYDKSKQLLKSEEVLA